MAWYFQIVVAAIAMFWYQDIPLGLVMAAAILLNLLAGALAGALIPGILKRMSIDPALAGRRRADYGHRCDRYPGFHRPGHLHVAGAIDS